MSASSFLKHSVNPVFPLVASTSKIKFVHRLDIYVFLSKCYFCHVDCFSVSISSVQLSAILQGPRPLLGDLIEFPRISPISFLL